MTPTRRPLVQTVPIGPIPLDDVAAALVMSRHSAGAALRRLKLPYWRDTRPAGARGLITRVVVPWETFWALRAWRWSKLVPLNGADDPREVFAVPASEPKPAETLPDREEEVR